MSQPYVRVADRPQIIDRLKQAIHRTAPAGVVRFLQAIARPFGVWKSRRILWHEIQDALPADLQRPFLELYLEARERWNRGERLNQGDLVELPMGKSGKRVTLRKGTCDVLLYYDVFLHQNYGRIPGTPRTIIDCGANIGLVTAYFLERYPDARGIAVEPDPVNLELCRRNLSQFGGRVTVLHAAVSSSNQEMRISRANLGTWSSQTRTGDAEHDDIAVTGLSMNDLMAKAGWSDVDLVKIDIEGAELDLFRSPSVEWVDRVKSFAIEPESPACRSAFLDVVIPRKFKLLQYSEILMAYQENYARGDRASKPEGSR